MAKNNDDDVADATKLESLDEEKDPYSDSTESETEGAKSQSTSERMSRNETESKSKTDFRESLNGLQEALPALRGKKASTSQVLNEAVSFIAKTRLEIEVSEKEVAELRKRNDELEMLLASYKASPTKQQSDNP